MIHLGPGGTSGLGYDEGLKLCNRLKLELMEVEFTYGVKMSNSDAKIIGKFARENNVKLSVHAPYYINLCSKEKEKITASKKRIIDSCEKASFFSDDKSHPVPIVFHAAFYQDFDKDEIYDAVKESINEMNEVISENKWNVILCPETTGKGTQFGTVDEIMQLVKETKCGICVDFAHILARQNGKIDYDEVLSKLPKKFHAHYSGINYSEKGERNHIPVDVKLFKDLQSHIEKHKKEITLIIESPDPFKDCEKIRKLV